MSMTQTDMIRGDIAEVMAQAEYNGGGIDSLKENALLNAGSVVKSVQRGTASGTFYGGDADKTITISRVSPQKSVLVANLGAGTDSSSCPQRFSFQLNSSGTGITLKYNEEDKWTAYSFDWQVIEFY